MDDQALILDGIRVILDAQPDLRVMAVAETGTDAVRLVNEHRPDVMLLDIQLPDFSGIEALKRIKRDYPDTVVLMLTTFDPDEYIFGAFENGADGYLLKDMKGEKLTARETEIAALIRSECSNEKIARKLGIRLGTTKNYISTHYSKLEVKTRQEAVRLISSLERDQK